MIISIPSKAKKAYIELCQNVKDSKTLLEFNRNKLRAQGYSDAIMDICGLSVWGDIIREAAIEIGSDEYPTCCGVPIFMKKEFLENN